MEFFSNLIALFPYFFGQFQTKQRSLLASFPEIHQLHRSGVELVEPTSRRSAAGWLTSPDRIWVSPVRVKKMQNYSEDRYLDLLRKPRSAHFERTIWFEIRFLLLGISSLRFRFRTEFESTGNNFVLNAKMRNKSCSMHRVTLLVQCSSKRMERRSGVLWTHSWNIKVKGKEVQRSVCRGP